MSHRRDGSLREVIGQRAGRYGRASTVRPGRHPEDRSILLLAAPALGALAADPLYSLIDTAFVGHLGPRPLAAAAIGNTAFTASFWIFSFLAYGVTPRVARAFGAGKGRDAATVGAQALLLALLLGGLVTVAGVVLAGPVVGALGAGAGVARLAEPYLRVRVLSAIPVLVAQVGHGWLRGAQDTRTPSYIALGGLAAGTVLDFLLIYPAGLGVMGAAWATFIAQGLVGACFTVVLLRRMEPV
ncbi:MAG TPA: MATE family efflux transporter, partial [Actinomycetota bacterium]|nr:MATE family efflux transporter [Actinomycetota bacterium]